MMEKVLPGVDKVIVDDKIGKNMLPHLSLGRELDKKINTK